MNTTEYPAMSCPASVSQTDIVTLAHGEGGRVMRRLIRERIAMRFGEGDVQFQSDAACLGKLGGDVALTTDSYVVSPLFFPGGDIGSLAVHGTVNDLAMSGARPLFLTLSLILEEGLPLATLDRVIDSVAARARDCDVKIVAGDTKVVPYGAADGMFINTAGVGVYESPHRMSAANIRPGDGLIISGPIARHGLAVLAARESIGLSPSPRSDLAPLHRVAAELLRTLGADLRTMRDATRGGVAAVLHEWAEESGYAMWVDEGCLPILPESRGVCELLGLDPLFIANEGTFVAAIAPHRVDQALDILQSHLAIGCPASTGCVRHRELSPVLISRGLGADQPLDEPLMAMLPRIC
jgi:hydrogenase expression/formation protein HypE